MQHVDAPEISEDVTTSLGGLSGLGSAAPTPGGGTDDKTNTDGDDQWADTSSGGWGNTNKPTTTSSSGPKVAELLDMQALNDMRNKEDDVAERLRIEETKAALARAKEGMEKEAERLVAEKEAKEAKAAARASGGSSMASGGSGGKWVPAHMRNAGGGSRFGSATRGPASMDGSGFQKSVDVASEELFPDLADADKIVADKEAELKKEQDRMATASSGGPTMAPAGWGSRMGPGSASSAPAQRKPLNLAPPAERKPLKLTSKKAEEVSTTEEVKKEEKKEEATPVAEETKTETPAPVPVAVAPVEDKPKKVLKKKKKKDLSTFKAK